MDYTGIVADTDFIKVLANTEIPKSKKRLTLLRIFRLEIHTAIALQVRTLKSKWMSVFCPPRI